MKKVVGGTTTRYISKLYECETTGAGTTCTRFIWAGNTRIATVAVSTGTVQYWHPDHLGSSTVITDGAGAKVQSLAYYPYGGTRTNTSSSTPPVDVPYKYTGKELDASTGLYDYGARLYDPVLGRFISADTIVPNPRDPQDLNRYTYAGNSPFMYTDPTGHFKLNIGKFFRRALGDVGTTLVGVAIQGLGASIFGPAHFLIGGAVLTQSKTGRAIVAAEAGTAAGVFCGPICGGAVGGAFGAALQGGDIGRGTAFGALTGAVSLGAGWFAGGLINVDTGSYWAQIGKGVAVGALKGASVSLAVSIAHDKLSGNALWQSAVMGSVIGGGLGAARPIVLGQDITDRQEMLGARIVAENIQGRDFSGVRFVEGGILQGLGPHDGITLGGLVNFDSGRLGQFDWVGLVGHELGHVSQQQDVGLLRFQFNYVFGDHSAIELDADFRAGSTCYAGVGHC
ncbi:hypothetical protein W02_39420 [Nitrospira sp. KM1]|uniref:RHS repeat-associated core domain-containing protein n=1 Tax=Nitrospira sp. KM1 TaxID=1936990 RepID=UPI0013A7914B|nr:RHS repeat-associated core domain-containing protein [Nitrospira sp. KM1]BCA56802.1 hypothetical protein W02_39420 [Nitrospira sp. KM1]